jgi:hypothetical protein
MTKRRQLLISSQHHIATAPAITTVRPAKRSKLLPSERHRTITATSSNYLKQSKINHRVKPMNRS